MNKTKSFVRKNRKVIIAAGITALGVYTLGYNKGFKLGYKNGVFNTFPRTIEWFDENFNTNLEPLWTLWKQQNPDKVVYYND